MGWGTGRGSPCAPSCTPHPAAPLARRRNPHLDAGHALQPVQTLLAVAPLALRLLAPPRIGHYLTGRVGGRSAKGHTGWTDRLQRVDGLAGRQRRRV